MRNLPTITKAILLLNVLMWLADMLARQSGVALYSVLGLHYVTADSFHFWQPLTYMFMHSNFSHLFCNMFAVLMFAPVLEQSWGGNKFLIYYIVSGLGAALTQEAVWAIQLHSLAGTYGDLYAAGMAEQMVTIGASGAVFGILLAFAWLFPEVSMFLLFIPIPIRARTFVLIYAAIELLAGFSSLPGDNVAHFAHLGGMLFGYLLLLWWRNKDKWTRGFQWRKHDEAEEDQRADNRGWHYHKRV